MAKKDRKPAGTTADASSKDTVDLKEPVFSADALSRLTQRIQTDFQKKDASGKDSHKRKANKKSGENTGAKTKKESSTPQKGGEKRQPKSAERAGPGQQDQAPRGLKRGRDDKPKPIPDTVSRPPAPKTKLKSDPGASKAKDVNNGRNPSGKSRTDKDALLREILELGGTQEDLELVNGVDSDSDLEEFFGGNEKAGKQVASDVRSFMKEIGLNAGKYADATTASAEEDGQDDAEWSDQEEEEDGADEEEAEEQKNDAVTGPGKGAKLIFSPRPDWHAAPLPPLSPPASPPIGPTLQKLREKADALLKNENETYSSTHLTKSSDRKFLSTIMQSGTLSDKISALTLICQESPLHTTKSLETLLGLARKKSRNQVIAALGAIKDFFGAGTILPSDRKLKFFNKQPGLGSKDMKDIHLLVWAYEDWLKNIYFQVLQVLEEACGDPLLYVRNHGVGYVYELLKEKPEQEANLLRLLVNKLGDTDKKVASKVSYLLLQLQIAHPAMKSIVINSIESEVIFRPGNGVHAKYYAVITLNQTVLSSIDHDTANKLLNIYFALFAALLNSEQKKSAAHKPADDKKMNKKAKARAEKEEKKTQFDEEVNAKLISAILTGVNRAFPFSKTDDEVFDKHMDTLFRITHSGNFNTSIQALMLIYQVSSSKQAVTDRFYRTLYESLLDQRLANSSKQAMYLNLLFKAIKADTSVKRVRAFCKRIIQSATLHQPPFICGVLYLLSELEVAVPQIRDMFSKPEEIEDDEEEVFRDVPEDGVEQPAEVVQERKIITYDAHKRDPQHANADRSCLWELLPFLNHFHPTVAIYATSLMEKKPMPSKPDLGMHTLSHFLERFVYRNPKHKPPPARGTSIMQPLAGATTTGMVLASRDKKSNIPVNSEAFWKQKVSDVGADEVFFHQYFNNRAATATSKTKKEKRKSGDDEEDEDEDEGEDEIWEALVKSRPEVEGDEGDVDFDDDDDEDLVDLLEDESMDDDSEGGVGLDDEDGDAEWGTEDDASEAEGVDEDGDVDMEAAFEKELAKATAKRAEALDKDEDETRGDGKKKRRKLKHLPTFASMEDYAAMLDSDSE